MSKKFSEIFDKIMDPIFEIGLRTVLTIAFVFGCLQFLVVAITTLFGMEYTWLQYIASVVLFVVGIFSCIVLVRVSDSEL